jgi:hypothetical protein
MRLEPLRNFSLETGEMAVTVYYEVKKGSGEGISRWVEHTEGYLPGSAFDEGDLDEDVNLLTGRTVEIDDSFTVMGTPEDWIAELQRRCREAVAT